LPLPYFQFLKAGDVEFFLDTGDGILDGVDLYVQAAGDLPGRKAGFDQGKNLGFPFGKGRQGAAWGFLGGLAVYPLAAGKVRTKRVIVRCLVFVIRQGRIAGTRGAIRLYPPRVTEMPSLVSPIIQQESFNFFVVFPVNSYALPPSTSKRIASSCPAVNST
jgi:hypothetical protein